MTTEVVMPRLGWTMEVGTVVEWLKQDGDAVEVGDLILAIETDKAINEVEAYESGILRIPSNPQIGVELPVGAPLGFIVQPGEPDPFLSVSASGSASAAVSEETSFDTPPLTADPMIAAVSVASNGHAVAISPRARALATANGIDWSSLTGSGSTGRIREVDIRAAMVAQPAIGATRAAPSVRRLAEENGVDLAAVPPSRSSGRVTRSDVLGAVRPAASAGVAEALGPIRRVIVERMTESARTVAPVTLTTDADATELVRVRDMFKAELGSGDPVPSFNDILIRLAALTLLEHPDLNASLTEAGIVQHPEIHVGLAVDTERGLLVPVVRDADRKSIHQIAADTAAVIPAAQRGAALVDQLRGSTFTISSLGTFGIDAFTPIINLPECAILGVGRIKARAVVIDEETGELGARKMLALSLTFDHRVVDGAPAARFLQSLVAKIERPFTWLTR